MIFSPEGAYNLLAGRRWEGTQERMTTSTAGIHGHRGRAPSGPCIVLVLFSLAAMFAAVVCNKPAVRAERMYGQGMTYQVTVPGSVAWYDTGIPIPVYPAYGFSYSELASGTVTIAASGTGEPPAGDQGCTASSGWIAPGLPCWSLVGRFGSSGTPFFLGPFCLGSGPEPGHTPEDLYLSVNDQYAGISNDSGSWSVQFTISVAGYWPTNTFTLSPTNTFTVTPTNTFTPTPTNTLAPTHTSTPVPTNTSTPIPTNTFTPVPSNTFTPVPTNSPTPTFRTIAASRPITATPSPTPTRVPKRLPTSTPQPRHPTATPTPHRGKTRDKVAPKPTVTPQATHRTIKTLRLVAPSLTTTFARNNAGPWPTGKQANSSAGVEHGRYIVTADDGYAAVRTPIRGLPTIADGTITALVQLTGKGKVGIMGRLSGSESDWNLDACWVTNARQFGCTAWRKGLPLELLHARTNKRILSNKVNTLQLQVTGNRLQFSINGRPVYQYVDKHPIKAGTWGAFVVSQLGSGPMHGQFLRISISGRPVPPPRHR